MHTTRTVLALAASAAALSAAPAAAQSILLPSGPEKGVALEAAYTDFKIVDVSAPSSTWFLSGRLPVGRGLRVFGDLPFAYGRVTMDFEEAGGEAASAGDAVFGNPRLGAEYLITPSLTVEGSFRLPLTSASETTVADMVAFMADPQRGEAFVRDVVPVAAALSYERGLASGLGLRARAGGTTLFFTGEDAPDNVSLLDYGLFGTYASGPARLGAGFSGRWNLSEDDGGFADNSQHWLGLTADATVRGVRPGISLRLPLDEDYREFVGPSVGLYLQVPVR
jgi:hypothetical protein